MLCVKCKKDIPDGAPFCCWCGKRQAAGKRGVSLADLVESMIDKL